MGLGTASEGGDVPNRCAGYRLEMLEDIGLGDGHSGSQCRFREDDFRARNSTVRKRSRLKIVRAELGTLNQGRRE